jgi:sugar lactone lactonase YvrE
MTIANDGVVYICKRENARIQLYDKQGKFLKNIEVPRNPVTPSLGVGSQSARTARPSGAP